MIVCVNVCECQFLWSSLRTSVELKPGIAGQNSERKVWQLIDKINLPFRWELSAVGFRENRKRARERGKVSSIKRKKEQTLPALSNYPDFVMM